MINYDKLNRRNALVAFVVQACVGAVSPNMRMISFSFDNKEINLFFALREASDQDAHEIDDIASTLVDYSEVFAVRPHINVVGNVHLPYPSDGRIVVFKQREDESKFS